MSGERLRTEDGCALVVALLTTIVVAGIVVAVVATALLEVTQTRRHRDRESSVHAAEAALEVLAHHVEVDPSHITHHEWTLPPTASVVDERSWAIAAYRAALVAQPRPSSLLDVGGGRALGIRPHLADGTAVDVLFGVAEFGDGSGSHRVVKVEFDREYFSPEEAILTEEDLLVSGNPVVTGAFDDVHTNGTLTVLGGLDTSGRATASGAIFGAELVTGSTAAAQPKRHLAEFTALDLYEQRNEYPQAWYDLCPDGSVRPPADPGQGPCSGTPLANAVANDFRGWTLVGDVWEFGSNTAYDGVYYVLGKNAVISGNPGADGAPMAVTVLVEAAETTQSGSLLVSGKAVLRPYLSWILGIADRDITLDGNADQRLTGFLGAREQCSISGDARLTGTLLSSGASDTPGSPVALNLMSGNPWIHHEELLTLPFGSRVRITSWSEL